jgi:hypothetical protein
MGQPVSISGCRDARNVEFLRLDGRSGRIRGNAVEPVPRVPADRGPTDDGRRACPMHPGRSMPEARAAPIRAGGSAGLRGRALWRHHCRRRPVCRRGERATSIPPDVPREPAPGGGRPRRRRVAAEPAAHRDQAWRRASPPSGRTFSHPSTRGLDASGGSRTRPVPLYPRTCRQLKSG